MFSMINKHEEFFDYLVTNAEFFYKGAVLTKEVLKDGTKLDGRIQDVIDLEHAADHVTHEIVMKMKKVFITPIDREDFYNLACNLDDCVDDIQDVLMSVHMYHAGYGGKSPVRMAEILIEMASELKVIFNLLKDIDGNETEISERAVRLNRLESEADRVYREAISDLFDGSHEVMEIVKWKEIIEALENTADQGEKVANLIKEVVMKYA